MCNIRGHRTIYIGREGPRTLHMYQARGSSYITHVSCAAGEGVLVHYTCIMCSRRGGPNQFGGEHAGAAWWAVVGVLVVATPGIVSPASISASRNMSSSSWGGRMLVPRKIRNGIEKGSTSSIQNSMRGRDVKNPSMLSPFFLFLATRK